MSSVLTGITTNGSPHLGNYVGAMRPAIELSKKSKSFIFLADYHSLIKQQDPKLTHQSTLSIAAAWIACDLDLKNTIFYRQSSIPQIMELNWILTSITPKGLMNRAHAYKAATSINENDPDKGITMGLFSYPVLMAADILMFDSTHVPVGSDQVQHLEMTRDIAARFNHLYKPILTLPDPIIQDKENVVPGLDGRKMSKSYGNVIPLLESEKILKKSVMKIVTNSLEPGEPKDSSDCTIFSLFKNFVDDSEMKSIQKAYDEGIAWGEAKEMLFNSINDELEPIRLKFEELKEDNDYINDLLSDGAKKARDIAKDKIFQVKEAIGITKIS